MEKNLLDNMLSAMLNSYGSGISDLNISVSKPLQVEHDGDLKPVPLDPDLFFQYLSPYQSFLMCYNMIKSDRRVIEDLMRSGSCDNASSSND